jgi:diguanylate cyclase (GGDEF)-like protein
LHREAQRLTLTDSLTGLWNDRYLQVSLSREVERAARFGRPLAVLKVDLDRFREINDERGPLAADAVLAEVAQRIKSVVREVDMIFRRAGERFVLLLPETAGDGACHAAERLCLELRQEPVRLGEQPRGVAVHCTVSIGVAIYPGHGPDAETLLERAEDALKSAKTAGRDTWRVAGEVEASLTVTPASISADRVDYPDASVDTATERG